MTLALPAVGVRPLEPVLTAIAALRARGDRTVFGLADGLVVAADPTAGWRPATSIVDGTGLGELLDGPVRLWNAKPHAAAALAYKQYTYWLAMPAVLGWATARRVPLLDAGNVAVRLAPRPPYLTFGMLRPTVAVLPDDPIAGAPDTVVMPSEPELLAVLRRTLLDRHVVPLVAATRRRVRIGAHTLYGQLAAGVAYVLADAGDLVPEPARSARTLLDALDMTDLAGLDTGPDGTARVRRNTCCLAFVVPQLGARTCPECCVNRRP